MEKEISKEVMKKIMDCNHYRIIEKELWRDMDAMAHFKGALQVAYKEGRKSGYAEGWDDGNEHDKGIKEYEVIE